MPAAYPKILYDNRFKDATPVASSTATGNYNVLNLRDWRAFTWWKPATLPATVTVDCGSAKSADYLWVWGHDLFTNGCTIELRGSTDNFGASDVLVITKTPTSNKPFMVTVASASYRYWRVRITGSTAPSLAIVAAGAALDIPEYIKAGFDPLGRTVKGQANRSAGGFPMGRVVMYEDWSEDLRFDLLTWTWVRASFLPAWSAHIRSDPFGYAWDPDGHADELYLLAAKDQFRAAHRTGGWVDFSLPVMGLVA